MNILSWFHPTVDAIVTPKLPLQTRLRLILFQPFAFLVYLTTQVSFSQSTSRMTTICIPVRDSRKLRALIVWPKDIAPDGKPSSLRPLHLDIHGGAFIGGNPEANHRFCTAIAEGTGAIVVSPTYRFAPRHPFPTAIDDIDDVIDWLLENAEFKLDADPHSLTIGGTSAGGNLALAACMTKRSAGKSIKAVVTAYAAVDIATPPWEKPRSAEFPKYDPFWWMLPLYDAYGASARPEHNEDPRATPYFASVDRLPERVLMIVPTIDIVVAEQLNFAKRINEECEGQGLKTKVEVMLMEKCMHGWLELPSFAIDESTRTGVFGRTVAFLKEVYAKHQTATLSGL